MAQIEKVYGEYDILRTKVYLLTETLRRNNVSRWFKKKVETKLADLLGLY